MFWLVSRLVVLPVRATAGGFKLGFLTGRVLGYRRLALVGLGAGIGLLVAPGPGAELRARLRERLEEVTGGGAPVPPTASWDRPGPAPFVGEPDLAAAAPGAPATRPTPPLSEADLAAPPEPVPAAGAPDGAAVPEPPPVADAPDLSDDGAEGAEPLPAVPDADPAAERPAP